MPRRRREYNCTFAFCYKAGSWTGWRVGLRVCQCRAPDTDVSKGPEAPHLDVVPSTRPPSSLPPPKQFAVEKNVTELGAIFRDTFSSQMLHLPTPPVPSLLWSAIPADWTCPAHVSVVRYLCLPRRMFRVKKGHWETVVSLTDCQIVRRSAVGSVARCSLGHPHLMGRSSEWTRGRAGEGTHIVAFHSET